MEVVLPMFRAMVEGAEAAVLDMHAQRWDGAQPPATTAAAPWPRLATWTSWSGA